MSVKGEDLNIRVEQLDTTVMGDKRTHLPLMIHWVCPTCGSACEHDLTDYHLNYPDFGGTVRVYLVCETCCDANADDGKRRKCAFSAHFRLTVNLELLE